MRIIVSGEPAARARFKGAALRRPGVTWKKTQGNRDIYQVDRDLSLLLNLADVCGVTVETEEW